MTPTMTPTSTSAPQTGERCDRCSAAAKVRAVLPGGGDLVFCQHHANEFKDTLGKVAVSVTGSSED